MAVAWIGNPDNTIPFAYLDRLKSIRATIGVAFEQSHPNGLRVMMEKASLRIAENDPLFHPKVYLFSKGKIRAAFVGSSNLTYQGFAVSIEMNVMIVGDEDDEVFALLSESLEKWRSRSYSFLPDEKWLARYEQKYMKRREKLEKAGMTDEIDEDNTSAQTAAWLATAPWSVYVHKVMTELRSSPEGLRELLSRRMAFFDRITKELPIPWNVTYFQLLENRKLIGGMYPYGWLGHVAASGSVRHLLKNGTPRQQQTIVDSTNHIAILSVPIPWKVLQTNLQHLARLGPTMKVWSRLLAITRPDLYCTISSPSVQKNLSKLLKVPKNSFESVAGYIKLLQLIHDSPWFRSPEPIDKIERQIWQARTALMDTVFYEDRYDA